MFEAWQKNWQISRIQKKINNLSREILEELRSKTDYDPLEYGNLRKGSDWGVLQDNVLSWSYLIDLIIGKPVLYIINFQLSDRQFLCFAKTPRTNFSSVFQFKTKNFQELRFRLLELAQHIPSLRERMLREYLYSEAKKGPRKKWYKPFVREEKMQSYLNTVISSIVSQNKITENEAKRLRNYAVNLT